MAESDQQTSNKVMISLSTRAKVAIKTALAMTIAIAIPMQMGWEKPYWAGLTVAMIALQLEGQMLNKAAMRMLGTLLGVAAALTFLAWFIQERWWLTAVLSLYIGFFTYMFTANKKHEYFWYISGFVCVLITVNASNSANVFEIAIARAQETGLGILVYSLVSVLLWPQNSGGALNDASRKLFATQVRLYGAYRGLMAGQGAAEDARALRMQEVYLLGKLGQVLAAAETDTHSVWDARHQWRRFHDLLTALMEALERWRVTFPEIQPLNLTKLLPNLEAVCSELDLRFEHIRRTLVGQPPERMPQAVTLVIDKAEIQALNHLQKAAVVLTKTQIDHLEALSRSLFESVRDLRGYGGPASKPVREETPRWVLAFDPDRFAAALRLMATLWIAFLLWVYVDPPGHEGFVYFAVYIAVIAARTRHSPSSMFLPFALSAVFTGILYVFVMPHLVGYVQLGLMIFGWTFGVYYLLWEPHLAAAKTPAMVTFFSLTFIQNEQTYSFASYANSAVKMLLAIALVTAVAYIPRSPRPEKVFLNLLSRFFRNSEFLMARLTLDWEQKKELAGRWKTILYRNSLLELPEKLQVARRQIDYRMLPETTPEQMQALVMSLHEIAWRINEMVLTRRHSQAEWVKMHLLDDLRVWHEAIRAVLQRRADNPTQSLLPIAEVRSLMVAHLARLEASIEETFAQSDNGELSTADDYNLYRLLGSYRGLSEDLIDYIRLAEKVNWAPWREVRF